jgi:hypothetical protein
MFLLLALTFILQRFTVNWKMAFELKFIQNATPSNIPTFSALESSWMKNQMVI